VPAQPFAHLLDLEQQEEQAEQRQQHAGKQAECAAQALAHEAHPGARLQRRDDLLGIGLDADRLQPLDCVVQQHLDARMVGRHRGGERGHRLLQRQEQDPQQPDQHRHHEHGRHARRHAAPDQPAQRQRTEHGEEQREADRQQGGLQLPETPDDDGQRRQRQQRLADLLTPGVGALLFGHRQPQGWRGHPALATTLSSAGGRVSWRRR
jgi:hypothetical protein